MSREVEEKIRRITCGEGARERKAQELAEAIRQHGPYRWVGIYDVGRELVSIVAWSGPDAPAHPTFPVTKGITGAAIGQKATVVVGDVRADPRYLIAFGTSLSEIIVPVLDAAGAAVVGTIDVESDRPNAFSQQDQETLEHFASAARALWTATPAGD